MFPYGQETLVALKGNESTYDGKYYISTLANGYHLILIVSFGTVSNGYSYNLDGTINAKIPDTVAVLSNDATKYGFPYSIDLTKATDILQTVTGFDTPQKVGIKYNNISFYKEQDGGYSTSLGDGKDIMREFFYDKDGKFVKIVEMPITNNSSNSNDATLAGLPYSLDLHNLVMNNETHIGSYPMLGKEGVDEFGNPYYDDVLEVTVNEAGNIIIKKDIYQYIYSQDNGSFIKKA